MDSGENIETSNSFVVVTIKKTFWGGSKKFEDIDYATKNVFLEIFRLDCSEAAVRSHPFSNVFPENTVGGVLLLVKLQTGCSE